MSPLAEHPKLYIATSAIHGVGLFSKVDFYVGEIVFRLTGTYTCAPYNEHYRIGSNWFSVGLNYWIIPRSGSPGRFLNHSCSANTQLSDDFAITAIRQIEAGAEILIDYSTTELDPHWQMLCQCRTWCCRGVVKPFYQISGPARQTVLSATPQRFRRFVPKLGRNAVHPESL
jgi:uncharacterized protein